jgi:hypothetical protein
MVLLRLSLMHNPWRKLLAWRSAMLCAKLT